MRLELGCTKESGRPPDPDSPASQHTPTTHTKALGEWGQRGTCVPTWGSPSYFQSLGLIPVCLFSSHEPRWQAAEPEGPSPAVRSDGIY